MKKAHIYFEVILHILLWSLLGYVLYQALGVKVMKLIIKGKIESVVTYKDSMLLFVVVDTFSKMLLFYINSFLLIPPYLKEGNKISLIKIGGVFIATFCLTAVVAYSIFLTVGDTFYKSPFLLLLYALLLHVFILFFAFGYRMTKDWTHNEKQKKQIESEQLRTELSFLKSQINPHFLFNTLNNLYAEARKHEDKTVANGIAKLSQMMRYMIYDSNVEFIALEKEIQYLNSYIELQKLRIASNDPFEFKMDISSNTSHVKVAPILFIPFVENAFKHGLDTEQLSFIHITIAVAKKLLTFEIKNSRFNNVQSIQHSGIGLNNIRRRLELLYPNRHTLDIIPSSNQFCVSLKIELNPVL